MKRSAFIITKASVAKVSESKFSRVLAGRSTLSESERNRIAETLGCLDHTWLFREFTFVPRSYIVHDEPGMVDAQ